MPFCSRLVGFEVNDVGIAIVAQSAGGLTMAASAVQAAFPTLHVVLEVKPTAVLQYGHVGTLHCLNGEFGHDQVMLGELLLEHVLIESELDACFALDYHQEDQAGGTLRRTVIGEELYKAKYDSSKSHRIELTARVFAFIQRHPLYREAEFLTLRPDAYFVSEIEFSRADGTRADRAIGNHADPTQALS